MGCYQLLGVATSDKCSCLNGGCPHKNYRVFLIRHLIIT